MAKSKAKSTKVTKVVRARPARERVVRTESVSEIQDLKNRIAHLESSLPRDNPLHPDAGGGRSPYKHPEDVGSPTGEVARVPRAPRVTRGQRAKQRK